ncbi:MAG: hypothetical protein HY360_00355 [Verrucomicrobia bacterium]|nr:hypothetical protein [Verrucomicrobiota bacterium]
MIYISDMRQCRPIARFSEKPTRNRWRIIPYETTDPHLKDGQMIGAASYVDAPEVRLPLRLSGWHAVYVGYWNPYHAYDGGLILKCKLSGDPCFVRLHEPTADPDQYVTCLREAFVTTADLTGRDLVFGKVRGPFGQKAYLAYVKLVPLTSEEIAAVKADRARKDARIVQVTIDGASFMAGNEYTTKEHILELVERYRYSDVGKVIWAVMYGDVTSYPSRIATFNGAKPIVPIRSISAAVPYAAYCKVAYASIRKLTSKGIIPAAVAARRVHQMGLKFDIMCRLGITGGSLPPMDQGTPKKFLPSHPEYRQVLADGAAIDKASYAFSEVRRYALSIIREAAETFDCDGVNLAFVRGPYFVMYEKPVLDAFHKEYGKDARSMPLDDPRLIAVRCRFLTGFVRAARRALDEVGAKKRKRIAMSAYVFFETQSNLKFGIDAASWMKEGLLDSIICQQGKTDHRLIAAAKTSHCKFISQPSGGDFVKSCHASYEAGADGVAVWDADHVQDQPPRWAVFSRAGHKDELQRSEDEHSFRAGNAPELSRTIRLKTVGGIDVFQGLWHAAFSCG